MHYPRRYKTWLALVALVILAVLVYSGRVVYQRRSFNAVQPKRGELTEAVYGLGKFKSTHRFEVKLGVISTVKKLYVHEGDFVHQGDKLIEFESNGLFRAPFDGTVTLTANYDGETVVPQMTVLRLEDIRDRFIELSLEQEGALRVRRGQPARISLESVRGKVYKGVVRSLFSREDEFLAQIDVEGLDESVIPGMTADVTIEIGKIPDALLIPLKAVHNGTVLLRRDGKQLKVQVEVGHVDGLMAEVKGDVIRADDEILVKKEAQ